MVRKHAIITNRGIVLNLRTNLFLGTREMGEKILNCLIRSGEVFTPSAFWIGQSTLQKQVKFDPRDLSLPLESWTDHRYSLGIIAERREPVLAFLNVAATDHAMFDNLFLRFSLSGKGGEFNRDLEKLFIDLVGVENFLKVAKNLYTIVEANSGAIANDYHEHRLGEHFDRDGNLLGYNPPNIPHALPGLFWANFFGPEYVDLLGREKLLSSPVHEVRQLQDGGLLLLLSESPFDAPRSEYQAQKKRFYDYLGDDVFTGDLLPNFRVGPGRKVKDARPLVETGGSRDDIFWHSSTRNS